MTLARIAGWSAVAGLTLGSGLAQAQGGRTTSGALVGYTSGSPLDRRPLVPAWSYAPSVYTPGRYGSLASPIFMTTLNTPGIYGAYSMGVAPLTFNREPLFFDYFNDREVIPAISVTMPPLRDPTTAAGAPTLAVGTPSTTQAVPGYAALGTIPAQRPAAPSLTTAETPWDNVARVVVRVPEDARLEFGGVPVDQPGRLRKFTTPALTPGQRYTYDIQAAWSENGRPVTRERQITVFAGEKVDVDFLSPEFDQAPRELRTQPLPAPKVPPVTAPPDVGPLKPTRPPAGR
jgi:uncharacterized protein (TIGR03000 family)